MEPGPIPTFTASAPAFTNAFIFLKADKKNHKIDLETIHYIEAIGDYMKVITDSGQLLVNETMKKMQEELPASLFQPCFTFLFLCAMGRSIVNVVLCSWLSTAILP